MFAKHKRCVDIVCTPQENNGGIVYVNMKLPNPSLHSSEKKNRKVFSDNFFHILLCGCDSFL